MNQGSPERFAAAIFFKRLDIFEYTSHAPNPIKAIAYEGSILPVLCKSRLALAVQCNAKEGVRLLNTLPAVNCEKRETSHVEMYQHIVINLEC
jgi:hypothetical protein